jgi:hypothetical protein
LAKSLSGRFFWPAILAHAAFNATMNMSIFSFYMMPEHFPPWVILHGSANCNHELSDVEVASDEKSR